MRIKVIILQEDEVQRAPKSSVYIRSLKLERSKACRVWSLVRGGRVLLPSDFHMEETDTEDWLTHDWR